MAKQRFKSALNAATFPLVSIFQQRTVMQPQLDSGTRVPQPWYGTPESADISVPQLLYCENVIPTAEGIQSVDYSQQIPPLLGATMFDQAITIRDADENNYLFSPAGGLNYIYRAITGTWASTNPISAANRTVTRAYVNGRTFICYQGLGIYEYDASTNVFAKVTMTGIADADIDGIAASNNYLIAYVDLTVYWSSLIDPLDFIPSLTTGAGFSIPQDVKAKITAVLGTAGGFIIYTSKNAVAAVYSQNIRAPFTFKEIANAGGVLTYEQITSDQNSGPQYAWTTGGLQKITTQGSEPVSAEVNDFLAGKVWESWDSLTKTLTQFYTSAPEFQVKLAYIASRYLIISYSVDNSGLFQYALVYDTTLKRWGKLKIDHVDCFPYPYPNVTGNLRYMDLTAITYAGLGSTSYAGLSQGIESVTPSKRTIAFLSSTGEVQILNMDYNKSASQLGVAIFGKFQLIRARMMTSQIIDFEGVYSNPALAPEISVTVLASLDGFNTDSIVPMILLKAGKLIQRWAKRVTGLNMSIAVEGVFALSSAIFEVTAEGDR